MDAFWRPWEAHEAPDVAKIRRIHKVFSRNLLGLHRKDEENLLVCLSTSGNSRNIIDILKLAKKLKIFSFGFLGGTGGKAKKFADKSLIIPSKNTANIQEEHMFIFHYVLNQVEKKLLI